MRTTKPKKPYPDYPLFPHASGQWAKKIQGRLHYFGKWENPQAALEKYLAEHDSRYLGLHPNTGVATVADVLNAFRRSKIHALEIGSIAPPHF